MPFDITSLPVSGGVLVAGAAWAGLSAFVLGPLVAERSAETIGWMPQCERLVADDIMESGVEPELQLMLGCHDVLGVLPPEHRQILETFGLDMACEMVDAANDQKKRLADLKRQKLERAVAQAGSKCACAVSHMTVSKRWDFAVAAGSARTVMPSSVANIGASLLGSLASPSCANLIKAEG
ncbi:hypothetical protein B7H23_03345 [Notoacmeibacter marinus]|uniref:Uncharacterized protein n=1 Tax=Notoacmeibacter marinus TaxID=1876515 RepID=A0A231V195_9HYPH|nr:hypothetical protein [Notoacmeibacter marinus]OXT01985.1 hypothetical protein B7H23_03345 [Notoacmeibacter marinus]